MRFRELQNLRVAILGMGREGQAVWRGIRKRYPDKSLDMFTESALDGQFASGLVKGRDRHFLGPLEEAPLAQYDVLVRSAGISPYREELQRLKSSAVRFTTASNLWFAENPQAKTICISGTMGKSTTAALTAHLLTCAGLDACLAGNIGKPMLDCEDADPDWWVLELSSYQLADLEARPGLAVLLNLSAEHLDWHGGFERYAKDKLRLADLAGNGRIVANYLDPYLRENLAWHTRVSWFNHAQGWWASDGEVDGHDGSRVRAPAALRGQHNMHNLAAVLTLLDKLEIAVPNLAEALATFKGLPHRLQSIGEKAGIRYVNDSISTTPVSVTAALETIGHEDVVLLLGGKDRGLEWNTFAAAVAGYLPYAIITMPDNGPKIFASLERAGLSPLGGLHRAANLEDAVKLAQVLVPPGGCILLSPGAPSFPHFRDFVDRGNQFTKLAGIEKDTRSP
jgi:UDP-N-acetylmuramoylalanine--D-glutamate ligase